MKIVYRILILLLLFLPIVYAQDYYADIEINVDDSGFVTIEGETNHPKLLVQNSAIYTSKKQDYWLLNISLNEQFSEYVYSVDLPVSASINYIKSSGFFRIEHKLRRFVIKGFGENKPLSILVQYKTEKTSSLWIPLFLISLAIISFLFVIKITKAKKPRNEKGVINLSGLSARQKKIMNLLIQKKKPLTQKQIQLELKLPKSSISRNIKSLELRNLIEKEQTGMSNMIKLK
jgi:hypothetical protein